MTNSPLPQLRRPHSLTSRHRPQLSALLLAALLLVTSALPLAAQDGAAPPPDPAPLAGLKADPSAQQPLPPLEPGPDGRVTVLVQLEAQSAADVWVATSRSLGVNPATVAAPAAGAVSSEPSTAEAAAAAAAYPTVAAASRLQVATVAAQQESLAPALAQLGAVELYRAQRVYNAIAVRVPVAKLAALRALPGVRAIQPLLSKAPGMTESLPFLGIPALWQGSAQVGPLTGNGIRIGVIDTGIDYIHRHFGGSGSGYELNDTTIVGDVPDYPSAKVVGGFDFVGDSYNANPNSFDFQPIPNPDPDPADCFGHGTHVAGTIGGYGVTTGRLTYPGPFNTTTPFETLLIGPGVAPRAQLYALRVFGCAGTSDVVDLAIEWAVDPNGDGDFSDRLDIINMSLGAPLGSTLESTAVASERAAELGVVVIASAGNSGPFTFYTGTPGIATGALSVAATFLPATSDPFFPGGSSDLLAWFTTQGPRRPDSALKPEIAAPGVSIVSALNGSGSEELRLSGTSMAAPHVAGAAALLLQQRPSLTPEQVKALLINTAAPVVRAEDAYTSTVNAMPRGGTGRIDIPSAVQNDVFAWSTETPGLVTLSFGGVDVVGTEVRAQQVQLLSQSPYTRTYDLLYTPTAPDADLTGVNVTLPSPAAVILAPGGSATVGVTLTMSAAQMTNGDLFGPDPNPDPALLEVETGWLWLWPRVSSFAASASGAGATPPNTSTPTAALTSTFNPNTRALTWSVNVAGIPAAQVATIELRRGPAGDGDPGPAYTLFTAGGGPAPVFPIGGVVTLDPADLPLLAGGFLQLTVTLTPNGSIAGQLKSNRPVLKLPLHVAPRPASSMRAAVSELDYGDGDFTWRAVPLVGQTLALTGAPTATVALVTPHELHIRSPRAPADPDFPTPPRADIRYVGVTSDFNTVGSVENATLSFAIGTWGSWNTPAEITFNIFVDTTGDDVPDYRVYNGPAGSGSSDRFVTRVQQLGSNEVFQGDFLNGFERNEFVAPVFNTDTMVLRVPASELGLTQSASSIRFTVVSDLRVSDFPSAGEQTDVAVYDLQRPGLTFTGPFVNAPTLVDQPGSSLVAGFNRAYWVRSTAKGILLVHHHNVDGQRAEEVGVRYRWPVNIIMPIAGAPK